jgi:hypothetical protein
VSFATITLCVASQRVFVFFVAYYFVMTQYGNFWIHHSLVYTFLLLTYFCISSEARVLAYLRHFIRNGHIYASVIHTCTVPSGTLHLQSKLFEYLD